MFATASTQERTAQVLREALQGWRSTADSWFDGTPGSITKRIAGVDQLMHRFRSAGAGYHGTLTELKTQRGQLADMRNSLLHQANQDRETIDQGDDSYREGRHQIAARAFVRENIEAAHIPEELRIRAARYADLHQLEPGFTTTVLHVAATVPRPKVASEPPPIADFDDQLMFL